MMKRGVSAVEVMVACVIAAIVIVPLLTLLFQERTTTVRGHLYFLAYLAAREEIGDIRFRLAAGDGDNLGHGWTPLTGPTFKRLTAASIGGDPGLQYEESQARIETKVDFAADAGGMKIGKLSVRYAKSAGVAVGGGEEGAIVFSFSARKPGPVSCP
jgi:hypothetical protein